MSWDAEAKPVMTNRISVQVNGEETGRVIAKRATAAAIRSCIVTIHQRLLRKMSTKGLQSGLMSQGRPMRLVRRASRLLSIPKSLRMTTEIVLTMKYGRPSAKYRVGTHSQGERAFIVRG